MIDKTKNLRIMIFASLFTSLTIVGSYISIPTGIVPIVLSTLFIYIGSLILGKKWATISVGLYLFLGILGLPVFSGGNGGFHHFYGPTGGFLIGYLFAAFLIGMISEKRQNTYLDIIALIIGTLVIHGFGILWLSNRFPSGWEKTLPIYWVFIVGDSIKIIVSVITVKYLRPIIQLQKR